MKRLALHIGQLSKKEWLAAGIIAVFLGLCLWTLDPDTGPAQVLYLVPAAGFLLYTLLFHFRLYWGAMILLMPLSIGVSDLGKGFGLSFPSEGMLFLLALVLCFMAVTKGNWDRKLITHPVSLIILFQLVWILVTLFASTHTFVSVKFLIARLVYVGVFYFFCLHWFRKPGRRESFLGLFLLGFTPVVIYGLFRMAANGFARPFSPVIAEPFFSDHTIFGAVLALLYPLVIIGWRNRRRLDFAGIWPMFLPFLGVLMTAGLLFSYSRAAWMSLVAALGLVLLLRIRASFWVLLMLMGLGGIVIYASLDSLGERVREAEAKPNENVLAHAGTVTDLQKDESNLERINRWSCAIRMFEEKPVMGFGPGTYEREYGVFQVTSQMTRISTFDGDRGDAHSEYLGALAEQGFPGMLLVIVLFLTVLYHGMGMVYRTRDLKNRLLATGLVLGLFTYYIHGGVNSFLDIDKGATLFWAMTAMLVSLSQYPEQVSSDH